MALLRITRQRLPIQGLDLTELAADLTELRTAMLATPTFVDARPEDTLAVRQALSDCLIDLSGALASAESTMSTTPAVAGVVAGGDPAVMATGFLVFFGVASEATDLLDIQSFLERMQQNIEIGGTTCSDTSNYAYPVKTHRGIKS